ncbi:MAG: SBBP repeat-containing protein, partial [Deltaproteobacteria bacterium]|nr:SBBP repeat-containing protein [Deltaproteobacteria bacterium]
MHRIYFMKRLHLHQNIFCKTTRIKYIFVCALLIALAVCSWATRAQTDPVPGETVAEPVPEAQVQPSLKKASCDNAKFKASYLNLPLHFEANQGQSDPEVRYMSRGSGYILFLTDGEAVLALGGGQEKKCNEGQPKTACDHLTTDNRHGAVLRMKLLGANPKPNISGLEQLPGKSNYFIGNDCQKWTTGIPSYQKVEYRGVYPGVDLIYYGNQRRLEYDFIVAPGTNPGLIRLQFEGAEEMRVDENGDLVLTLSAEGSEVRFRAPITYQEIGTDRRTVASRYFIAAGEEVGFEIGVYDADRPLIIDPVLDYATYLGDSDVDQARHVTVDASGNAYVTGSTQSTNFPTTGGAYDTIHNSVGFDDIFVTKFNAAGSGLVYSTFIGGGDDDRGNAIAVDTSGNAYIVGTTTSSNFPTVNAYDTSLGGTRDAIVAKLSSDGSTLLYSTYYGGSGNDGASVAAMALDSSGNVYFTGQTGSGDLPLANAYDNGLTGPVDVYVAKINTNTPGASGLQYSSYLGGTDQAWYENPGDIGFDGSGNIYVIGNTSAIDFPT